jgi:hypothetical protein
MTVVSHKRRQITSSSSEATIVKATTDSKFKMLYLRVCTHRGLIITHSGLKFVEATASRLSCRRHGAIPMQA